MMRVHTTKTTSFGWVWPAFGVAAVLGLFVLGAHLDAHETDMRKAYVDGYTQGRQQAQAELVDRARKAYAAGMAAGREAERALAQRNREPLL